MPYDPTIDEFASVVSKATKGSQKVLVDSANKRLVLSGGKGETVPQSKPGDDNDPASNLRRSLRESYGNDIANEACATVGAGATGSLTVDQVKLALNTAANLHTERLPLQVTPNEEYLEGYEARNNDAAKWKFATAPSSLKPGSHPGLRYSSTDKGGMRVHGWHMKQHGDTHELDDLVRAEMRKLPDELSDGQKSVQARLNLLDRMLTEADGHLAKAPEGKSVASANLFVAPEWLFTGMVRNKAGDLEAGGALTEGEMQAVTRGLAELSGRHPNMVIMPGTILWSKPAVGMFEGKAGSQHADLVFNTSPVMCGGELVHNVYKSVDGGDAALSAKGLGGQPYDVPSEDNGYGARMQLFPGDPTMPQRLKTDENLQAQFHEARTGSSRDWEEKLMGEGVEVSDQNNFFVAEGRTFAVEVCADHASGSVARRQFEGGKGETMAQLKKKGGVDVHVVIAAGSTIAPNKSVVKPDGILVANDLNVGAMSVTTVGVRDVYNGHVGKKVPTPYQVEKVSFSTKDFGPKHGTEDDSSVSVDDEGGRSVGVKPSSSVRSQLGGSSNSSMRTTTTTTATTTSTTSTSQRTTTTSTGRSVRDLVKVEPEDAPKEKARLKKGMTRNNS